MGTRIGSYAVLKQLAAGPKADVLLARPDGADARHVVIKRIRKEHTADAVALGKYVGELRDVAGLGHKHVLAIHDVVQTDGDAAIVMEYLHGEDLRKLLSTASRRGTRVPLDFVLAITGAIASGLHHAHERRDSTKQLIGIVHRNVSPSNILVGYDGSIKCTDFGALRRSPDGTGPAEPPGRVSYLSPEQCLGGELDRRSDVYSLGVVLYELATTSRLFQGSDDAVIDQIVHGEVEPPEYRRPDLPAELSAIILRAIALDPADRYATCNELRIAIDQLAGRSGRATTAALAGYLRDQFGERPEPWLGADAADPWGQDSETRVEAPAYSNAWTEVAGGAPRSSSRPIPVVRPTRDLRGISQLIPTERASSQGIDTGQVMRASTSAVFGEVAAEPTPAESGHARASVELPDVGPLATPAAQRGGGRFALIGVPVVLVGAVAFWKLAISNGPPDHVTQGGHFITPSLGGDSAPALPVRAIGTQVIAVASDPSAVVPDAGAAAAPAGAAVAAISKTVARTPEPSPSRPRAAAHPDAGAAAETSSISQSLHGAAPELPAAMPVAAPEPEPVAAPPPVAARAPAPPPSSRPAVVVIAPQALEANRIVGSKDIAPDGPTALEIRRVAKDQIVASYKLCVAPDGSVSSVTLLKSTGFAAFDTKIEVTIRDKWRYRSFLVDGKPTSACSKVGFIYAPKG